MQQGAARASERASERAAQCEVGTTLLQDVTQLGNGLTLFASEAARELGPLDPSRPFNGSFAAPLLAVAVSGLDRLFRV